MDVEFIRLANLQQATTEIQSISRLCVKPYIAALVYICHEQTERRADVLNRNIASIFRTMRRVASRHVARGNRRTLQHRRR